MRKAWMTGAMLVGALAMYGPALAGESSLEPGDQIITIVSPGEQLGISCDALSIAQQNSDVRVVLTISAAPGDVQPGYDKVLATDQQVSNGAVHVKVPNTPDIADHTYDMSVYVMDNKGAQSCDAGAVKVARTVSMLEKARNSHQP
jgi:hypothetical protein